ncbi:hypothetical protein [Brevundimonas sp.]
MAALVAMAGCGVDTPLDRMPRPSSAVVAAQIEAVFKKTCGIAEPTAERIDTAVRALGVNTSPNQSPGTAFYSLRNIRDGVWVNVGLETENGVFRCSVSASESGEPVEVVEHLAATIQSNGGIATTPLESSLGYNDCHTFRVGDALQSACTFDFLPHGISANLILTVPTDAAASS